MLHICQAGSGVIVRMRCEELSSKKWIVHANWLREGAIVGVLLLAYFTWGNLLDRFVWMFVHLTQKKVVGTARCMIPTLKPSCTASDIDSACFRSLVLLAPMPICGIWKVKYVSDTGSI